MGSRPIGSRRDEGPLRRKHRVIQDWSCASHLGDDKSFVVIRQELCSPRHPSTQGSAFAWLAPKPANMTSPETAAPDARFNSDATRDMCRLLTPDCGPGSNVAC